MQENRSRWEEKKNTSLLSHLSHEGQLDSRSRWRKTQPLFFRRPNVKLDYFSPRVVRRWKLADASFERSLHTRGQPSGIRSRFSIIGSQLLQIVHDEQDQTTGNLTNSDDAGFRMRPSIPRAPGTFISLEAAHNHAPEGASEGGSAGTRTSFSSNSLDSSPF